MWEKVEVSKWEAERLQREVECMQKEVNIVMSEG
jgi:hypothetical protein